MLFIYPMWDSESQRLGLKACTPRGYVHSLPGRGDRSCWLVLLPVTGIFLIGLACLGWFHTEYFGLFLAPFAAGVLSESTMCVSRVCAKRKRFDYDAETRTASWIEQGVAQEFQWKQVKR